MTWYAYMCMCSDGTLYTGITNDLDRRIEAHNQKKGAKYTLSRLPVKLVWHKSHNSKVSAQKHEWYVKSLSRREKLDLIANSTLE